ncbi:helix-turn-helix domain-containing protein [Streptomyces sp. NPDC004111]|uniref:helix-turn-helix domain-containing protein n=1 Tax=Streptomyces sp. NPDC004111 TaxID=3364690 RepID=UPI0036894F73
MPDGKKIRVTDAEREELRRLHAAGHGRNEIARRTNRSLRTISVQAATMHLSFDRTATEAATRARMADLAERRTILADALTDDALRLSAQVWEPAVVYSFGGKDNTYVAACAGTAGSANATAEATRAADSAAQGQADWHRDFEISVKTRYSDKIKIKGYNQHNDYVISPWVNSPNDWTKVKGWWWNGTVEIVGYQNRTHTTRSTQCTMPFYDSTNQKYCDAWDKL